MQIGIQLYSVRDFLERDFDGTVARIASMGYKGVEFAGYYGHSAAEISSLMKKYDLMLLASHVQYNDLKNIDSLTAFSSEAGCKHIVISWADEAHRPGGSLFAESRELLKKAGKALYTANMPLLYHNHDFEMKEFENKTSLDYLLSLPEAEYVSPELDTAWIRYAGKNPCDFISRYSNRLSLIHIKDFIFKDGNPEFVPVGCGVQQLDLLTAAVKSSSAEWAVVEQDTSTGITSMEAAEISFTNLSKALREV